MIKPVTEAPRDPQRVLSDALVKSGAIPADDADDFFGALAFFSQLGFEKLGLEVVDGENLRLTFDMPFANALLAVRKPTSIDLQALKSER